MKLLTKPAGLRTKRPRWRVAVLGCGPAGLFAAHAAQQAGYKVDVFSKRRRSEMFGAQYLHDVIPDLTVEEDAATLSYELRGTAEEYAEKVYGASAVSFVSPDKFLGSARVYDIRGAYYRAYTKWFADIVPATIDPNWLATTILPWKKSAQGYGLIISSIPAPALCFGGHQFRAQNVWAIGDAPERGTFAPDVGVPPMTVVCNGEPSPSWYRAANIFGYKSVEWPEKTRPPIPGVASIRKPIDHRCDCYANLQERWMPVGRFGAWDKGVLSHSAFYDVQARLA